MEGARTRETGEGRAPGDHARILSTVGEHIGITIAGLGAILAVSAGIGADRQSLLITIASAVPLLVTSRAWRLPWALLAAAAAMPLSVLVVAAAHADALGVDRAGKLAYLAALLVGLAAWARTPGRRGWLALGLVVLGAVGLARSLASWSGAGLLVGFLDWHNQTADFLLPAFALGLFLVVLGLPDQTRLPIAHRAAQLLAAVAAGLLGGGLLLTGSRYGIALAAIATATALVAATLVGMGRRTWWPAIRLAAVVALAALVAVGLRAAGAAPVADLNPLAVVQSRGTGIASMSARLDFWQAALGMGAAHPITGAGLLRFPEYANCYADLSYWGWTPHNDWLYAWAEGGLVLLAPMLVLTAGLAALVVRALRPFPRAPELLADAGRWGGLVAVTASAAALLLEYDLFYPPILTMIAGGGALAVAGDLAAGRAGRLRRSRRAASIAFAILLALVAAGFVAVLIDANGGAVPWVPKADYPRDCPL